ncbi:MAG: NADH-quinone oxidoreductase subunit NuoE [Candidatus Limnocylindrales bacterium]
MSLGPVTRERVGLLATRYPTRRAALLPSLWLVQEERGWIAKEDLAEVAGMLGLAAADAEGVASFYFLFSRTPTGRTVIDVCDNIICRANGAEALLGDLCAGLGIAPGGTTADGAVTVRRQECIAACHEAPAVQVDLEYRGQATAAALLAELGR